MSPKKTALYERHVAMGAHMIEFANTLLPVRYASEREEHLAVRNHVGIFDVSHMGELAVSGANAQDFLQRVLTNNVEKLSVGQAQYTLMLNGNGGIIDDLLLYKMANDEYFLCVNAVNISNDLQHLLKEAANNTSCLITNVSDQYSQLAIQGPKSEALLTTLCDSTLPARLTIQALRLSGIDTLTARTGYTGEDGFEIFVSNEQVDELYQILLAHGQPFSLTPCGLAARDSLRIEAGLLLHGNDMDESTTPVEAQLLFAVDRNKIDFVGKEKVCLQLNNGRAKKLMGFTLRDKGIARHGFNVVDEDHRVIGIVTSATFIPDKQQAIGFAYIDVEHAKKGRRVLINIRGRLTYAELIAKAHLQRITKI